MNRRWSTPLISLLISLLIALALALTGCGGDQTRGYEKSVIVIGLDGLDWQLTRDMIASGDLPHLAQLMREGHGQALETSVPPLSPIAWSDFITGMDSGGHGIFDFLHRDPETLVPVFAMARSHEAEPLLTLGQYQIPGSGGFELLRHGEEFWTPLEAAGVPTWIYRMPVNFPPSGTAGRELSGMGTPDLLGTYGIFSFYTSALFFDQDISGGEAYGLDLWEDRAEGSLYGPPNPFRVDGEKLSVPLVVSFDPEDDIAEIDVNDGETRVLLTPGEWSDWVTVRFEMIPTQTLSATTRFYLRSVRPEVEFYASPLQIDPMAPAMPISTPAGHAGELARATGLFYTQGMPEDTKAITERVFSHDEFLAQAELAHRELVDQFEYLLDEFQGGLLFYYFGGTDQVPHIMWGMTDPEHPGYDPDLAARYAHVVPDLYREADRIVGYALDHMPEGATLIVMSDHGFASWRRSFNLNSWLRDEGYLAVKDPNLTREPAGYANVDWSRTRAYGAGFNGLYLNLRGRESNGIVGPSVADELLDEIGARLLEAIDSENGKPPITRVYESEEFFRDRGHLDVGPDMLIGYAKTYKGSNEGALGELSDEVIVDNLGHWTGDHSMDHTTVPGVFFSNRKLEREVVNLRDLASAVTAEFGVDFPTHETTR